MDSFAAATTAAAAGAAGAEGTAPAGSGETPPDGDPTVDGGGAETGEGEGDGVGGEDAFLNAGDVSYTAYRPSKVRVRWGAEGGGYFDAWA